jgi:hypothetical protein
MPPMFAMKVGTLITYKMNNFRIPSFSRPKKLPLKVHTGSGGTFFCIHTGWKKPYFFQIGQVLVVKCRVRMFPIFAGFLSSLREVNPVSKTIYENIQMKKTNLSAVIVLGFISIRKLSPFVQSYWCRSFM